MKKFLTCKGILFVLAIGLLTVAPAVGKEPRFKDVGDGTIIDSKSGLMWAKKDSWAQTGKCLDWEGAKAYAEALDTGGHTDWRMPTMDEMALFPNGIVERSKTNSLGVEYQNWSEEYTLNLDPIFGPKAAYWLWSSETDGEKRAGFVDFRNGQMVSFRRSACWVLGVRAVRKP